LVKREAYREKAIERLKTAEWCLSQGLLSSCASNLYFAYFNYFQYILEEAPHGRWRHIGIVKAFVRKAVSDMILSVEKVKRVKEAYDDLYAYRVRADYTDEKLPPEASLLLEEYIKLLREVMEHEG